MISPQLGAVMLYQQDDGMPALEVRLEADSVWLSQQQIADLFQTSRTNIVEHIRHVYEEGELDATATCRKYRQVRQEGKRKVAREVKLYNLDLILSVGYRVKSKVATQFRIWATQRLQEYLVRGFALNQSRLAQLGTIVQILGRSHDNLISGLADVLAEYLPGLQLLRDFDAGEIPISPSVIPDWVLTLAEARVVIQRISYSFPKEILVGKERGDSLAGIIGAIYQGYQGQDLYPTVEEKAANLLYLVVKDHPLFDGNKRSASTLFLVFLSKNGLLYDTNGAPRFTPNALAAITLLVAMSDPNEKDLMVALVIRMINKEA